MFVPSLLQTFGQGLNIERLHYIARDTSHCRLNHSLFFALSGDQYKRQVFKFLGLSDLKSARIAFALSFSSTVFGDKVLDEKGEMSSLHGKIAIGILIMQDMFVDLFITAALGKVPSIWA